MFTNRSERHYAGTEIRQVLWTIRKFEVFEYSKYKDGSRVHHRVCLLSALVVHLYLGCCHTTGGKGWSFQTSTLRYCPNAFRFLFNWAFGWGKDSYPCPRWNTYQFGRLRVNLNHRKVETLPITYDELTYDMPRWDNYAHAVR